MVRARLAAVACAFAVLGVGCAEEAGPTAGVTVAPPQPMPATTAASPSGPLLAKAQVAAMTDVVPGFVLNEREMYRADGSRVMWYPDGGALREPKLRYAGPLGLVMQGRPGRGQTVAATEVFAILNPETGALRSSVSASAGTSVLGVNARAMLIQTPDEFVGYGAAGQVVFRQRRGGGGTARETLQPGTFTDFSFVTAVLTRQSVTYVERSPATGEVLRTHESGSAGDPPAELAPLLEPSPRVGAGDRVVISDHKAARLKPDGSSTWSVPVDQDAEILGAGADRVLLRDGTGDLVVLDAALGRQLRTLPEAVLWGEARNCGTALLPAASVAALNCADGGTPVVLFLSLGRRLA